jgi:biopolymer transport protein ExbD
MIARPLELAARLQPAPRNFDALFYVNAGLLALFFMLFASKYVLEPGLGVDFRLPAATGASRGAIGTTCHISVLRSEQIFTDDGLLNLARLPDWLKVQAGKADHPALLIRASANVPVADVTRIIGMARAAGFGPVILAAEEPEAGAAR